MKRIILLTAVAGLAAAGTPASAAGDARNALLTIQALNLIVLGNYNASADVEGKTYVGGTLSGSASLGIGNSANGQSAALSNVFTTLAVGGSNTGQVNLNTGNGVGGNYGAYIAGSAGQFNVNGASATIRAGSLPNNINLTSGSTLLVAGNVSGISAGAGGTIRVGGNATSGNYNLNSGTNIEVAGNLSNVNLGLGTVNKVGGNVSNVNGSNGATLFYGGSLSGNANTNGATFTQTNFGGAGAPAPSVPVVGSLAATTAQIKADVDALSAALGGLTMANNPSTITYSAQGPTLNAIDNGAGYALFNVTEAFFSFSEINYNFASTTLPVIVNIARSSALAPTSYSWNLNPVGGANSAHNQQVIFNFLDATSVSINREVQGSILAAQAVLSNNGPINGSLVVRSFYQGGEVHLGTYARSVEFLSETAPVPEPGVWLQMILGFGLAGVLLRRRPVRVAS